MGSDFHTFHVHGHRWLGPGGVPRDTQTIGPAESYRFRWREEDPGTWLYHCHVEDHMMRGMIGTYRVSRAMTRGLALVARRWCSRPRRGRRRARSSRSTSSSSDFGPSQLDVLPGETVEWTNVSERRHTVTSDAGLFDSGDLFPAATLLACGSTTSGAYAYHCTVHAGMVGEVDVRRVILGPLPTAAVPAGDRVEVTRPDGRPVAARSASSAAPTATIFATVASATPAADGTLERDRSPRSRPPTTARRRARTSARPGSCSSATAGSPLHATRGGVARHGDADRTLRARVVLQLDLRERFGWWPVAQHAARLSLARELPRAPPGARARRARRTPTAGRR